MRRVPVFVLLGLCLVAGSAHADNFSGYGSNGLGSGQMSRPSTPTPSNGGGTTGWSIRPGFQQYGPKAACCTLKLRPGQNPSINGGFTDRTNGALGPVGSDGRNAFGGK